MANNNNSNNSDMICDMCEGTKEVGYVKPTLKVCEDCDVDGCNYDGWNSESDYESDCEEHYDPPKLPKEPTIEDYTRIVGYESCWVDVKEYSHNLIGFYLRECDEKYGREEANNIIKKTGLEKLGWKTLPLTEK